MNRQVANTSFLHRSLVSRDWFTAFWANGHLSAFSEQIIGPTISPPVDPGPVTRILIPEALSDLHEDSSQSILTRPVAPIRPVGIVCSVFNEDGIPRSQQDFPKVFVLRELGENDRSHHVIPQRRIPFGMNSVCPIPAHSGSCTWAGSFGNLFGPFDIGECKFHRLKSMLRSRPSPTMKCDGTIVEI